MNKLTKNILVTGMQGSGKSYLTKQWRQMGIKTIDADEIQELGKWYDKQGKVVDLREDVDEEWLQTHSYLWDRLFLQQYLNEHGPLVVLGASKNTMEMLDLFDQAYYLQVPAELIANRLLASDRENVFGSTEEQNKFVVTKVQESDASMADYPIVILDGTQTPQTILEQINL